MFSRIMVVLTRTPDTDWEDLLGFVSLFVLLMVGLNLPVGS